MIHDCGIDNILPPFETLSSYSKLNFYLPNLSVIFETWLDQVLKLVVSASFNNSEESITTRAFWHCFLVEKKVDILSGEYFNWKTLWIGLITKLYSVFNFTILIFPTFLGIRSTIFTSVQLRRFCSSSPISTSSPSFNSW